MHERLKYFSPLDQYIILSKCSSYIFIIPKRSYNNNNHHQIFNLYVENIFSPNPPLEQHLNSFEDQGVEDDNSYQEWIVAPHSSFYVQGVEGAVIRACFLQ